MQIKYLLPIFVLCLGRTLSAQTAVIEGRILEKGSELPVPGASVYLAGTTYGTATNGRGFYRIEGVPPGTYTLAVSAIGYRPANREIEVKAVSETITEAFWLEESITDLAAVTVMTEGHAGANEIPGSVTYLSPKRLNKFSHTDINRILRAVPGVNLQEEDGFGLRPNIGLRGTGTERSAKITLMEDGVLMAPAPYVAPSAYYFPTIGRMRAVEILKGSSQIKYGPYTTGGAINLISTPIPDELTAHIKLLTGSFGGKRLHTYVGNSHQQLAYLVETHQYRSKGFKVLDGGGDTGFSKQDYLAKVQLRTKAEAAVYQSLTFKLGYVGEVANETYLGLTREDFERTPYRRYSGSQKDRIRLEQNQLSLTHLARLSPNITLTTTAYRTSLWRNWYKLDKVRDSTGAVVSIGAIMEQPSAYEDAYAIVAGASTSYPDALLVKANNRNYSSSGIQTQLELDFTTGIFEHELHLGMRWHTDQMDRFQWVDEYRMEAGVMQLTRQGEPGTESNRIESARALATYLQYKLSRRKWMFVPGIRYENMLFQRLDYGIADPDRTGLNLQERSNRVGIFIPGMGVHYKMNKYWSFFCGIHKGFSPPGSKEGTKPEESVNYELGLRVLKGAFTLESVLFVNDYSNLLGSDLAAAGGGGSGDLYNAGEVLTKGWEFQLSYDLLSADWYARYRLPLSLVYTYTDSRFQNSFNSENDSWGEVMAGDEFPYLARHQLAVLASLEHPKFSFNLSGRYTGAMRMRPGQGPVPADEKITAYFVMDAGVSYLPDLHISFFANLTNVFNKTYLASARPAGLRPGMPRAIMAGIKAVF